MHDLRFYLERLNKFDKELICINQEVNSVEEIAGIYRYVGAYGTIMRPTKRGPAILFNNIKGYPDIKILIGLLSSRNRIAKLMGSSCEKVSFLFRDAVNKFINPILISNDYALSQQKVYSFNSGDLNILDILPPFVINRNYDAGPYFTFGVCCAADPEDENNINIAIHRLCIQSRDELSIYFVPGRHLDVFYKKAEKLGKPLPISINIGVDPIVSLCSCFEPPITPIGCNELSIAGSIHGQPIELVKCLFVDCLSISNAEIVVEGEVLPELRVAEDKNTNTGKSMPEFSGYTGCAQVSLPLIKIKAITTREYPIFQTCIGSSDEHVNLVGIPTEASILYMLDRALPGFVLNVHCPSPGGGKYLAILQVFKRTLNDEGKQRQAALLAFSSFSSLKHVILVDDDVNIFDTDDVLWAMTTRYQGDISTIFIPGVRCHPLDPSSSKVFNPLIQDKGIACKTIFDCTVPYAFKENFSRSIFKNIDISRFIF